MKPKVFDLTEEERQEVSFQLLLAEVREHIRRCEKERERALKMEHDICEIKEALVFIGMQGVGGLQ